MNTGNYSLYFYRVSIPKRVSEALNLKNFFALYDENSFQSLKGFQRL